MSHVCEIYAIHLTDWSVQCCSFGEEPDSNHPQITVFSRCCSMWLLALPKSQRLSSKVIILRLKRNVTQHNSSSQRHRGASCNKYVYEEG